MRLAPHNVGGPVSTAAALHLNACTTNAIIQENFNDFDSAHVMQSAPGVPKLDADGCVALPCGPGLGVEVDEALIAAHPSRKVHFNLFAENWQKRTAKKPTS
jgi:galactonate dehydratase